MIDIRYFYLAVAVASVLLIGWTASAIIFFLRNRKITLDHRQMQQFVRELEYDLESRDGSIEHLLRLLHNQKIKMREEEARKINEIKIEYDERIRVLEEEKKKAEDHAAKGLTVSDEESVFQKEHDRDIREYQELVRTKQAEVDRLIKANQTVQSECACLSEENQKLAKLLKDKDDALEASQNAVADLSTRNQDLASCLDEKEEVVAELRSELEKRTERATELYLKNKQICTGLDQLSDDLRDTRGATSVAYLSEKIEEAITVLKSYIKGN